jgi:Predicted metal binding domain
VQYADPELSRTKFEREIEEFRSVEQDYRSRGWFLIEAAYPRAVVLMTAPQIKPSPVVFTAVFDYSNYDAEPPSVQLVDSFSGVPYLARELPVAMMRDLSSQPDVARPIAPQMPMLTQYMVSHSPDEVPFLCIAGVREYHQHPAHSGDSWELHRATGAGRLVRLLDILYKYGTQAIKGYAVQVQLLPQITGFQVEPPR